MRLYATWRVRGGFGGLRSDISARSDARAGAPVGTRRVPNLELIPPRVVRGLGVRPVPSELGQGKAVAV